MDLWSEGRICSQGKSKNFGVIWGAPYHITEYSHNLAKMDVVRTLREYSGRYLTEHIGALVSGQIEKELNLCASPR